MTRQNRPSKRTRAAAAALYAPAPERLQHGRVSRSLGQVVDEHGNIGLPWHAESLLAALERSGDISARERHAGERFQEIFRLAALDVLHAIDPSRVSVSGGPADRVSPGSERARNTIAQALDAMGGPTAPASLVCWYVLGLELSLRDFERREGWSTNGTHRRPLDRKAAKGMLVGALGVLEVFFRL
jgi:hypothetical protein